LISVPLNWARRALCTLFLTLTFFWRPLVSDLERLHRSSARLSAEGAHLRAAIFREPEVVRRTSLIPNENSV
jgi:hypothetical protein